MQLASPLSRAVCFQDSLACDEGESLFTATHTHTKHAAKQTTTHMLNNNQNKTTRTKNKKSINSHAKNSPTKTQTNRKNKMQNQMCSKQTTEQKLNK